MRRVVLDASLALALVLPDESSRAAERLLEEMEAGSVETVTALHWQLEVANGLHQASRRRRISAADRLIACDFLFGLPVTIANDYPPAVDLYTLADDENLSVYDACYLVLALQRDALVATADRPLRRAARRRDCLWQLPALT